MPSRDSIAEKHCAGQSLPVRCGQLKLFYNMSQHRSLRAASTSGAKRNVMKRFERVAILKKRGQWKTGDRVTGLRKTKSEP
jgi:small basic protein (TIGR04137 family)